MGIYLGNLTVEQIEHRLGIVFSEEERSELKSARQEKASNIAADKWHCFDIPFMIVCGSYAFSERLKEILTPYASKMTGSISVGVDPK